MDQISQLAAELGLLLKALNAQVTTAESCTGGGIAEAITRIAGSSAWFEAGFVTYSNQQKTRQLDVPEPLFTQVGAVSREVVEAMVRGAQAQSGARFAVAVSGVLVELFGRNQGGLPSGGSGRGRERRQQAAIASTDARKQAGAWSSGRTWCQLYW